MIATEEKLKELIVGPGYLSEEDFDLAVKEAALKNKPLEEFLLEQDLIADDQLGRLIAQDSGFQFIDLRREKINIAVLELVPELMAQSMGAIAFDGAKEGIKVGMLNPGDLETRYLIEKRVGEKVLPYLITKRDLELALAHYKPSLQDEFKKILRGMVDKTLTREERDALTVQMVDNLLQYGYQSKASDIHIEPYRNRVVVRFRIDGVLHEVLRLPKPLHELIAMRLKILARMRTDEHRAAQDGKLRFKTTEEMVDVRVSVVPITGGENIVMRILAAKNRQLGLRDLGFSEENFKLVQTAIKRPHGMILSTGPTGCGKTSTLYAILKILNRPEVNIATIEDPVEYDIEGISQIQVNPKTNLTFAKGLRAIVRQDPDIIMVGEIRDHETASIGINAALTGHLVLSTLHTNDAATTLPRLLDMGVEHFLVASTVNLAIAQRLVRKICEKCRASYQLTLEERQFIKSDPNILKAFKGKGHGNLEKLRLFKGKGCKVCNKTGYMGRTGLFELLEMTDNIKELVIKRASSGEIMKLARQNGMVTMLEDGVGKVLSGVTSLAEVLRVTRE